jgi:hypothetical protein
MGQRGGKTATRLLLPNLVTSAACRGKDRYEVTSAESGDLGGLQGSPVVGKDRYEVTSAESGDLGGLQG